MLMDKTYLELMYSFIVHIAASVNSSALNVWFRNSYYGKKCEFFINWEEGITELEGWFQVA
jgi:hypothetical protein